MVRFPLLYDTLQQGMYTIRTNLRICDGGNEHRTELETDPILIKIQICIGLDGGYGYLEPKNSTRIASYRSIAKFMTENTIFLKADFGKEKQWRNGARIFVVFCHKFGDAR